jgi:hypothetical protein
MSSWALLLALSGYRYDGVSQEIAFGPVEKRDDFRSFWSCGSGWGTVSVKQQGGATTAKLTLTRGALMLRELKLQLPVASRRAHRVSLNGVAVPAEFPSAENIVRFARPVSLKEGEWLEVSF